MLGAWGDFSETVSLANVSVSGDTSTSGSLELNQSLLNAKVWLIPGTFPVGSVGFALPWSPNNTLFETGLMDYYDADL